MTVHSGMLAEVLSDWGLLELLLGELRRRAKILRKAGVVSSSQISMNRFSMILYHFYIKFSCQISNAKLLLISWRCCVLKITRTCRLWKTVRDCSLPVCFKLCQPLLCVQLKTQVHRFTSFHVRWVLALWPSAINRCWGQKLILYTQVLHVCSSFRARPWYGSLHKDLLGWGPVSSSHFEHFGAASWD